MDKQREIGVSEKKCDCLICKNLWSSINRTPEWEKKDHENNHESVPKVKATFTAELLEKKITQRSTGVSSLIIIVLKQIHFH